MKLRLVEEDWVAYPEFDGDDGPERWMRIAFLRDTQNHAEEVLAMIQKARGGETSDDAKLGWGGNELFADFYPDGVVITDQRFCDGPKIKLSPDETESLVRAWQYELKQWRQRRGPSPYENKHRPDYGS